MADRRFDVLTGPTCLDLLSLDECKLMLGLSLTDTTQDQILQMHISLFSEQVAKLCGRYGVVPTFGKEEVEETWREMYDGRVFLDQWPVEPEDIVSVSSAGIVLTPDEYELEVGSGKVSNISIGGAASSTWTGPVVIHYSGGFNLPDEAPWPLKHATILLIREERIRMTQAQTAGIRSLSHKEARVMFFDPNALLMRALGSKSPTQQAVDNLLTRYKRFEV